MAEPISIEELSDVARPLCVDLDGTLVRTDTLWESVLLLLRSQPWLALMLPLWLLRGRARFKRAVAERVTIDAAALPYRTELVEVVRLSKEKGRRIILSRLDKCYVKPFSIIISFCFGNI